VFLAAGAAMADDELGAVLDVELDLASGLRRFPASVAPDPRPAGVFQPGLGLGVTMVQISWLGHFPRWLDVRQVVRATGGAWSTEGGTGGASVVTARVGVEAAASLWILRPWLGFEGGIGVTIVSAPGTRWATASWLLAPQAGLDVALGREVRAGLVAGYTLLNGMDFPSSNFDWLHVGLRVRWEPGAP
jgi:hypothetical protein